MRVLDILSPDLGSKWSISVLVWTICKPPFLKKATQSIQWQWPSTCFISNIAILPAVVALNGLAYSHVHSYSIRVWDSYSISVSDSARCAVYGLELRRGEEHSQVFGAMQSAAYSTNAGSLGTGAQMRIATQRAMMAQAALGSSHVMTAKATDKYSSLLVIFCSIDRSTDVKCAVISFAQNSALSLERQKLGLPAWLALHILGNLLVSQDMCILRYINVHPMTAYIRTIDGDGELPYQDWARCMTLQYI